MTERTHSVAEKILLVTAVVVLMALGYSIHEVLTPFVLVAALIYLLYPVHRDPLPGRLLWLGILLFVFWFVYSLLGLLAPFIIAFLLAYLFNPVVTRLQEKRNVPRWASSLLAVACSIGLIVLVILFIVPLAIQQFNSIISAIGLLTRDLTAMVQSGRLFELLEHYGIPVERARELLSEHVMPRLEGVLHGLFGGVLGFVTGISTILMSLINAVIIPFLVFYILMDYPDIMKALANLFPTRRRSNVVEGALKFDSVFGQYLRGAILVAIIQGIISAVGLWFIGVQYALILGIMTMVLNFIPYVGLIISLTVGSIVALFSGEPVVAKVLGVILLYLSQKLLEATVLGPKIIGKQVGMHPVLLILCLLVFGYFMGLIGMLIAVPVTAIILLFVKEWTERRDAAEKDIPQEL